MNSNIFVGLLRAADDREAYQNRVARKAALSNWLAEAAKTRISEEVDTANFQVRQPSSMQCECEIQ